MITKEKLLIQIESFPNELELEDLIERLLLVDKIEKRLIESENEDTISSEDLQVEIKRWSIS